MLKIRLTRRGKRNKAFFRVVVAEHTSPIKGRFVESLGFLNPHTKEKNLKDDRIKYWLSRGAQCSDTVHNLLVSNGILKGPKRAVKMKQKVEEKKDETTDKKPIEEMKKEGEKPEEKKEEAKEEKPTEKIKAKEAESEEKIKGNKKKDEGNKA